MDLTKTERETYSIPPSDLNISYLIRLPYDLLKEQALYLDYKTIKNLCSANRNFTRLCRDSNFWIEKVRIILTEEIIFPDSGHRLTIVEVMTHWIYLNAKEYFEALFSWKVMSEEDFDAQVKRSYEDFSNGVDPYTFAFLIFVILQCNDEKITDLILKNLTVPTNYDLFGNNFQGFKEQLLEQLSKGKTYDFFPFVSALHKYQYDDSLQQFMDEIILDVMALGEVYINRRKVEITPLTDDQLLEYLPIIKENPYLYTYLLDERILAIPEFAELIPDLIRIGIDNFDHDHVIRNLLPTLPMIDDFQNYQLMLDMILKKKVQIDKEFWTDYLADEIKNYLVPQKKFKFVRAIVDFMEEYSKLEDLNWTV